MCHKLDPVFFDKLAKANPEQICKDSLASWSPDNRAYSLISFHEKYLILPEQNKIIKEAEPEYRLSVDHALAIMIYMLKSRDLPSDNDWVSETSLTGGAMFFTGPHAVRNQELADHFGSDLEGFKNACLKLKGEPYNMGDAAFRFQVLPRIPVIVAFWYADDEFDAGAKMLMDKTIEKHLPLDAIFGMSLELYGRITGKTLWH